MAKSCPSSSSSDGQTHESSVSVYHVGHFTAKATSDVTKQHDLFCGLKLKDQLQEVDSHILSEQLRVYDKKVNVTNNNE